MSIDAITVTAGATAVYGFATLLLWFENRQDRRARDKQYREESDTRKRAELYSAFYEAWGYWRGQLSRSANSVVDAAQAGRVFEALIRLECQLRLNGYTTEAHNLGFAVRTMEGIDQQLAAVGVALKPVAPEYRQVRAVGFTA
jgi:hypothetical protein